ncbi:MAG: malate synthase, partial [Deltaproteobacteria bacterium]
TVLVETLPAAFEMDEILYELRDHSAGLNAGRWDYIFSLIKKLRTRKDLILPDRQQVTMTVPFMRAYTELLVKTCHRRGAHAMGGMAPFIPSRKNPEINEKALAQTRADKEREIADGFDGTWVAHPDLVPVAKEVFDRKLGKPHQKERLREEVHVEARELQDTRVPGGTITENGVRNNISVGVQYLASWLSGNGAAAIFNLMEDAATAEISRAQLWQWVQNGAKLADGRKIDRSLYEKFRDEEIGKLQGVSQVQPARKILDQLVLGEFVEFLTLPAYELLE